jgi:HSP20 family protein
VDVSETPEELVIVATMAGTKPEDIELHLHNDFLTIRGRRLSPVPKASQYFTTECYWGTFSRTIVLPVDVKADMGRSEYRNGVLAIYLPKAIVTSSIPIIVIED